MSSSPLGQNTVVQAEVDADLLRRAAKALSGQRLTVPQAIELMLKYVTLEGSLPIAFMELNAETRKPMGPGERSEAFGANRVEEPGADLNRDDEPSKTITAGEFDRPSDSGEDMSAYLDWGKEWR